MTFSSAISSAFNGRIECGPAQRGHWNLYIWHNGQQEAAVFKILKYIEATLKIQK